MVTTLADLSDRADRIALRVPLCVPRVGELGQR